MPRGIPNSGTTKAAKHNPVLAAGAIEAGEQPLGHTVRTGDPTAKTPAERIGEPEFIQVADRMPDPEKLAMLAFMAEPVTIRIATTSDKNADQVFELTINGRNEFFRRGETKTVARYYVDLLARQRVTGYTSVEKNDDKGEKYIEQVPNTALKYDFAVVKDANPMGESWLKATLGMPG
jgi:hypothetical protein